MKASRRVTLKELLEIVLVAGVHVEYTETETDTHSWQYHYVQSICMELARENPEIAKEIFNNLRAEAEANLSRLQKKGNGSNATLMNEISKLANVKYRAIDIARHYAPSKGDTSRDMDKGIYDGSEISELDIIQETESTLRRDYLNANDVDVNNRRSVGYYITLGNVVVECTRAELARGKKRNGTGSKGNRDSFTGFIWQLNK